MEILTILLYSTWQYKGCLHMISGTGSKAICPANSVIKNIFSNLKMDYVYMEYRNPIYINMLVDIFLTVYVFLHLSIAVMIGVLRPWVRFLHE